MSTPEGHKELWKNCAWDDDKEKLAFFNHYFKNSVIAANHMKETISDMKEQLLKFIETNKVKEANKERNITIKDIVEEIKKI